jgi:DNA-binding NarL/FixJ family response regulator
MRDLAIHVLFIDDEKEVLDGIARLLRSRCPTWVKTFVPEPLEALKVYARMQHELHLVVCDINMPQVSGLQIMRAVRERTPRIGIIALSGQLDIASLKGVQKFADAHLCKPVDVDVLCTAVEGVYKRKWAEPGPPTPSGSA